jgi:uncharacterized protein YggE
MNNKVPMVVIGIVVLAILGIGLAGCSTDRLAAAGASAVNVNVNNQQGIWVNGEGRITVTPDIANISLGVTAQADTVANALSQASTAMDRVMASLTSNGIDKKDIKTQNFNIQQMTRYDNSTQKSVVTGYQVDNMVSAKVRNVDKTGTILDSVAAAGGDLTRVNSVSFSVDKPDQYYAQARQAAMTDAKTKAAQLAQLGGITLGKVIYVTESTSNAGPVPIYAKDAISASAPSTAITPGTTDIVLDVQVGYAIE